MTRIAILSIGILALAACNNAHSFKKAEDAEDAGREFIRASLDGNYEKASFYLYADTTNKMMLAKWKKDYDRLSADEQQKYRNASIMPVDIHALNDSVTDFTYFNSYKRDTTTIRIIRVRGDWFVDLEEILYHHR
ncbi:MAG TPA: hypothetical protein VHE54_07470 [Puia sp.]|nr:hypothetical protein [Puia sp.]